MGTFRVGLGGVELAPPHHSQRLRGPCSTLKDCVCNMVQSGIPPTISTRPQTLDYGTCSYPLSHYICHDKFSSPYKVFLAAVALDKEPSRFSETVSDLPWRERS